MSSAVSPSIGAVAKPGPSGKKADDPPLTKKEQRRASVENLLSAALKLFITQGYHATSVEQIAHAAGLTKGAVYFYFKNELENGGRIRSPWFVAALLCFLLSLMTKTTSFGIL